MRTMTSSAIARSVIVIWASTPLRMVDFKVPCRCILGPGLTRPTGKSCLHSAGFTTSHLTCPEKEDRMHDLFATGAWANHKEWAVGGRPVTRDLFGHAASENSGKPSQSQGNG